MRTLFVSLLFVALPPLTAFAQDVCSAGNMSGTFTTDVTRTVAAGDWTVTLTGVGGNGHGRFSERGGSGATVRASYRIPGGTSLAFFIGEGGSGSADGAGGTGIVANGATLLMIAGGGGGAGDSNDGRGGLIDMTGPGGGNGGGSSGGGGGGGFGAGNAGTNSFNNSGAGGNAATLTSKGAGVAGSGAGFGAGGSGSQGGGGGGGYQGGNGGGIFQAGRGGTSFVETASFSGVFDLVNSSDGETGGGTTGAGADGSVQFDCSPYAPPITVTSTTPINGAASIARVSNVTATFSATISNASADATSFVVRGRQSGRRTGSVTVSGSTVTFDPTHDFFPGERIHVTPTSALSGTAGGRVVPQTGTFTAATAQGGGTFTQSTFGSDLQVITPIDYDRDGDIDIIAKASSTVELYQNNGSGSFSASSLFNLTNGSATPVDFDGDGDFDFVAGATTTGSVDWYENDGGTISYADDLVSSPLRDAFVTDLDADGMMDVVVATSAGVKYVRNQGGQMFGVIDVGSGTFDIDGVDVDGDGDLDFVANGSNTLNVLLNDGDAVSFTSQSIDPQSAEDPQFADVDGDGDFDIVSGLSGPNSIVWYANDGNGNFGTSQSIGTGPVANLRYVEPVDVDGDGHLDVVAAFMGSTSSATGQVVWYKNDGNQTFTQQVLATNLDRPQYAHAADFTGDGILDVIVLPTNTGSPILFTQGASANPEINVTGNGTSIASGDTTPDASDGTDFGSTAIDGGTVSRTFTIANTGTGTLTLGANAVTLTGLNRADFTVTSQPSTTVAASGSATFTVEFDPAAVVAGQRTATVVIAND
ncbi:MAG: FG-GAP-like repeat-containing protein, partial [Bacteroidota bacterium]